MALFGWLFGTRPKLQHTGTSKAQPPGGAPIRAAPARPAKKSAALPEIRDLGSDMLAIPALDFFGVYRRSPNGRFRVAWRDGHGERGGARDAGEGHYVLIDGDQIVAQGRMQRPNDGKIADNGNFILNDWRFTAELSGTFWAFKADGSPILSQPFGANLFNNGLSADGTFAACHTCNSGSESDSAVLAIFDLTRGEELTRFRAESGWPNNYEFLPDKRIIRLGYANGEGEFAYTLNGEFIERDRWIGARLERGDLHMVRSLLDEADGKPERNLATRLLAAVDAGLSHANWRDDQSQAIGWRLRGEVLQSMGAPSEALECYEKALKLNPKIGIKRRVGQLQKVLAAK
jgi:hypothetical protein